MHPPPLSTHLLSAILEIEICMTASHPRLDLGSTRLDQCCCFVISASNIKERSKDAQAEQFFVVSVFLFLLLLLSQNSSQKKVWTSNKNFAMCCMMLPAPVCVRVCVCVCGHECKRERERERERAEFGVWVQIRG